MKKGRFSLIVLGAILLAPPLGGFCYWIAMGISFAGSDIMGPRFSIYALRNSYLPYSYFFGLIPSLSVSVYSVWKVISGRPLYKWRSYFMGLILSFLNFIVLTDPTNLFEYTLLIMMVAVVTPTFFILYFAVKKLLPWAGTSLIEPTKAGTA